MDDWDEEKLEEVVNKKHGEKNKALPQTSIVSMVFYSKLEVLIGDGGGGGEWRRSLK